MTRCESKRRGARQPFAPAAATVLLLLLAVAGSPSKSFAATHVVTAEGSLQFVPDIVNIAPGDIVQFNNGAGFHIVEFEDDPPGNIGIVPTATNPIGTAGTHYYFCTVHAPGFDNAAPATYEAAILANSAMVGKVVVTGAVALVVTTTADSGAGSLREAITTANASPDQDTITFNIPPNDGTVKTITPLTALPALTQGVLIDGYSQPGSSRNTLDVGSDAVLLIELNGELLPGGGPCIDRTGLRASGGDGVTISGLVINRFSCAGVWFSGGTEHSVDGSFIGVDPTGTVARPNGEAGVSINGANHSNIGGALPGDRNVISGNPTSGVNMETSASLASTVTNNYIGTNAAGTAAIPNGYGILSQHALGNVIRDNLISGNSVAGVRFRNGANGDLVVGNRIGTDASGTAAISNTIGIQVNEDAGNVTIGGGDPADRNVISGNTTAGIQLAAVAGSPAVQVRGSWIGLDATGAAALPNGTGIALVDAAGGHDIGPGNVISGNGMGINVQRSAAAPPDSIHGNYVGTNATGTSAAGNTAEGIVVFEPVHITGNVVSGNFNGIVLRAGSEGSSVRGNVVGLDPTATFEIPNKDIGIWDRENGGNVIGGTNPGDGNIVAGNDGPGIWVTGNNTATQVYGNLVGTNAGGASLPNSTGVGVASAGAIVGGIFSGQANVIAFNGTGVRIRTPHVGTVVRGNSIYSNGFIAIDLINAADLPGATPNDPGDVDTGGNGLQNYPTLNSTSMTPSGELHVDWSINTKGNTATTIDFYASPVCGGAGGGQGRTWLGSVDMVTDGLGDAGGVAQIPGAAAHAGTYLSMTATTVEGTSEFSPCAGIASTCPGAPVIQLAAGATGEIWCGASFTPADASPELPAQVTAMFEWDNAAQVFDFWFRGFPAGFNTLEQVTALHHYFFQASGSAQIQNSSPAAPSLPGAGTALVPASFTATPAGAYGQLWFGTAHPVGSLGAYLPAGVTALFNWDNGGQQFRFWFRGFPDAFQTLTAGLQRGKYYFFQGTGGVLVPVN